MRLAISHSILAVSVFLLVGSLIYIYFEQSVRAEVDESLNARATEVGDAIRETGDFSAVPPSAGGTGRARVFSLDRQLLGESPSVRDSQIYSPANFDSARTGTRRETTVPFAGGNRRAIYYPIEVDSEVQAIVEVSESLVPTERALNQARISFLVAGTLALPAGLLAGWWMARQALIPVNRLTAAVGTLAASGEFDQRVAQPGADDEIGRLARTFNDILERLTVVLDRQQTLVADTSHELRNPLMVVRGNLDLLVHDLPADQRQEAVTEAREEVDRMARLVGDLLFLADADTAGSIQRAHVELDDILAEIMHDVQMVSPGHIVQLEANDEVSVLGDAERLRQLVWNLVENAMRYTPAGGTIILSLRRRARVAEIGVTDAGIGIPEEHLSHIFDRFYRVDRGRSRALCGTGRGLSIVRQVAEAHGGQVRVRSTVGVGTTFTVFLPMTEAPETLADAIG
ncbi:hypothetical protein BH23CHL1_BH23CHL1_25800 [soil metagenome]